LEGNLFQETGDVDLATRDKDPFVTISRTGSGYEVFYQDGIGLTNRYLAAADNAEFFLETLQAYAPNAKRVVFTDGTFGAATDPGLLETIGPWAEGAYYQAIFLFVVVVWTLNQRFGLPRQVRERQVGSREMVDALTDTMTRAKATGLALETALQSAEQVIQKRYHLRSPMSSYEMRTRLPAKLNEAMDHVRAALTLKRVRPGDALSLVVELERQVSELVLPSRLVVAAPSSADQLDSNDPKPALIQK
jgi:hypothetical protein